MTFFTDNWYWFALGGLVVALWQPLKLLIMRRFGMDIANHMGSFQQSGVKYDMRPGLFGKGKRVN